MTKERTISYLITNRTSQSKGVITSWDGDIKDLSKAVDDKDLVLNLKKLRKRIWCEETKTYSQIATKHTVVTMKGNVPNEISIFNG